MCAFAMRYASGSPTAHAAGRRLPISQRVWRLTIRSRADKPDTTSSAIHRGGADRRIDAGAQWANTCLQTTKEIAMTTLEVGRKLVELCKQGKNQEAMETL